MLPIGQNQSLYVRRLLHIQKTVEYRLHIVVSYAGWLVNCSSVSNCIDICLGYLMVTSALLFLLSSHPVHPCPSVWNRSQIFSKKGGLLSNLWASGRTPRAPSVTIISHRHRRANWPNVTELRWKRVKCRSKMFQTLATLMIKWSNFNQFFW